MMCKQKKKDRMASFTRNEASCISMLAAFFSRKYLQKMILTSILLCVLPCLIILIAVSSFSSVKINQLSVASYQQQASFFSEKFVDKVTYLRNQTAQIYKDSRDSSHPMYQLQRQVLLEAPVNYYTIFLKQLRQYDYVIGVPWGVYYIDEDILFYGSAKYTLDSFEQSKFPKASADTKTKLHDFFQSPNAGTLFCPLYDGSSNYLLLGIPAKLSITQDNVLFFFELHHDSIVIDSFETAVDRNAQYYLIDQESGDLLFSTTVNPPPIAEIIAEYHVDENQFVKDDVFYALFSDIGSVSKYDVIVVLPISSVIDYASLYSQRLQTSIICASLLLLFFIILLVSINYSPMQKMLSFLDVSAHDEWDALQNVYSEMKNELSKGNQRIMDFLINNLLYNVPISDHDRARLNLPIDGGCYLVCVIHGTFSMQERSSFVSEVQSQLSVDAYITDILAYNYTAIICCTAAQIERDVFEEWIRNYFIANVQSDYQLSVGILVDSVNQVHSSYLSCFDMSSFTSSDDAEESCEVSAAQVSLAPDLEESHYLPRLVALQEQVEEYVQANITDHSLCQTSVAEYFGLSIYSLSRLFTNQIGTSFSDYVNRHRLDAACLLLCSTHLAISEISDKVGFSNASYFSKMFKQTYHTSPSSYRKEHADSLD